MLSFKCKAWNFMQKISSISDGENYCMNQHEVKKIPEAERPSEFNDLILKRCLTNYKYIIKIR